MKVLSVLSFVLSAVPILAVPVTMVRSIVKVLPSAEANTTQNGLEQRTGIAEEVFAILDAREAKPIEVEAVVEEVKKR